MGALLVPRYSVLGELRRGDLAKYARLLEEDTSELKELHDDLLIGVTSFFRDPAWFTALADEIQGHVENVVEPTRELRAWVAGCASGEETYSIAILFDEAIRKAGSKRTFKLFATDVSQAALQRAGAGVYARERLERELQRLRSTWVRPATLPAADAERLVGKALEREYNLADLLRRPGVGFDQVCEAAAIAGAGEGVSRETLRAGWGSAEADAVIEQAEIGIKYAGYIDKQVDEVERASHFERLQLPADLDYAQVTALSFEVRQKLARHRPATLGQAARISGVTPAAISLLLVHLKKGRFKGFAKDEPADEAA